ncbi:hypothetical protein FKB33_08095 [Enterococcus faecium]|nr:hypothetical protein [Enterococcus faecium]
MLIDYNYIKGLNIMLNPFFNEMFSAISLFGAFYFVYQNKEILKKKRKYINQTTVYKYQYDIRQYIYY